MSVLSQCSSIIIDWGINSSGHGKEVVYGINAIEKRCIYQLMSNVQLPVSKTFDSEIIMHSCTHKNDVSLSKQFQKNLSKDDRKHGVIGQGKYREISSKRKCTDI